MSPDRYDLPIHYVDSPATLAAALPHWFQANLLAVDIECSLTGVHHCVLAMLQVATHDRAWLVDPLRLQELMPGALRAMAEVPWIAHDFSGDGVVFKRIYDVVPTSVMDTMLLARALGYPQPGLKTMARLKLGIDIPKEEQDSNWMLRPLRETQLSYAARKARRLMELRCQWGNEGDVAAVMELGNRWLLARLQHPPASREALERTIPNPRFRARRLDALWAVLGA